MWNFKKSYEKSTDLSECLRGDCSSAFLLVICFSDTMKQFDHPHIIKLIGVCTDDEFYIVMELAAYGEVSALLLRS